MKPSGMQVHDDATRDSASIEAVLMSRLAAGDRHESLDELYDRYATPLYRFGFSLLGDRQLAEELVQETFVRLWRSASRFDASRASVRGYVFLIARRVATDAHRRRAARPATTGEALLDGHPAPGRTPEELVEHAQIGVEVREALEDLPITHREVLELGYDEQLTQTEIAGRLGIPLGTVKTRTYQALRAMRLELRRRGIDG